MKASELIAELQRGIDEGRDWEIVCSCALVPLGEVRWHMPSLQDRQDSHAQPYITITQEGIA